MIIIEKLKQLGVDITPEMEKAFQGDFLSEFEVTKKMGKVEKERDDAKTDLETANTTISTLQTKLDGFKDVDVNELKVQIKTLTEDLAIAKEEAEKAEVTHKLESDVNGFLQDKEFVNEFTKKSIVSSLMEELEKDSARGKSISDIFNSIVNGEDGKPLPNILVDTQLEGNKARFTQKAGVIPPAGTKMTTAELMKLANENPGLDISQYITK